MEKVGAIQESGTLMDLAWCLLDGDCLFVFGFLRAHGGFVFGHGEILSIPYTFLMRRAEISYLQYHTRQ